MSRTERGIESAPAFQVAQGREQGDSLIEVGLRDGQEAAVSVGFDGEHQGLSGEHCQLSHHLPRVCEEEAGILQAVDLLLVDMQQPGDHKQDIDILIKTEAGFRKMYVIVTQDGPWAQNPGVHREPPHPSHTWYKQRLLCLF